MPASEPSSVDRWTIIRRRDWDHQGTLVERNAPVPEPDDLLEVIEVVPVAEIKLLREALRRIDGEVNYRMGWSWAKDIHAIAISALRLTEGNETMADAKQSYVEPGQIDRALAAWDAYLMECNGRRAAASMTLYGHTGAHIPSEAADRREAMRFALEAALNAS